MENANVCRPVFSRPRYLYPVALRNTRKKRAAITHIDDRWIREVKWGGLKQRLTFRIGPERTQAAVPCPGKFDRIVIQ